MKSATKQDLNPEKNWIINYPDFGARPPRATIRYGFMIPRNISRTGEEVSRPPRDHAVLDAAII